MGTRKLIRRIERIFHSTFTENNSLGHRIENGWRTLGDALEGFGNRFD